MGNIRCPIDGYTLVASNVERHEFFEKSFTNVALYLSGELL